MTTSQDQSSSEQSSTSSVASLVENLISDTSDSEFDLDEALKSDPEAMMEEFTADWIASDDLYPFALLIFQVLTHHFQLMITAASKIVVKHVNRSHKTVQKWQVDFLHNKGELSDYLRGIYARMGSVANDEELTKRATEYVRENAFKKGSPKLI